MTRSEAFTASRETGVKVTHRFFDKNEYLFIRPDGRIQFEDGVICSIPEFNDGREAPCWDEDWTIFE